MNWTAEEAWYALDQLIAHRKIRPADITRVLADRKKEIEKLRRRLEELEIIGGAGPERRARRVRSHGARRARRRLSARDRSRLRLQGRYMGYVRRLTAAQKAQVRRIREDKGWQAAITAARRMAKG